MALLINSLCNPTFHCFEGCSSWCPSSTPTNIRLLVQHTHFAKFLLLLKWLTLSNWGRYPAQRISDVLPLQTTATGGFKQGLHNFSGGKSQSARARSCLPIQEAWREGAGGSAGVDRCRNQTQPICQVYHIEHLKCWQVCSQSMVSRALVTPWSSLTPPMFTDSSH